MNVNSLRRNFYIKINILTFRLFSGIILFCFLNFLIAAQSYAADYKNMQIYKDAYACALEGLLKDGVNPSQNSLISYCVGNAYDPSKVEIQGFKDAIVAARNKGGATTACTFAYAAYQANGSRADGFSEGLIKVTTMKMVARLWSGREFTIYDTDGVRIPEDVFRQWFYVVKRNQYGIEEVGLTTQAKKSCSKKQIG